MTLRVSIRTSGAARPGRTRFLAIAEKWADEVSPVVRNEIRDHAPVAQGPGGGRLRNSVRYTRHTTGETVTAEFTTDVFYAKFVRDGTPPHIIRPRNARMLRWLNQSQDPVYARQVNHPGTAPNDFPLRAVQPLVPMLQAKFAEIAEQSIKEGTP